MLPYGLSLESSPPVRTMPSTKDKGMDMTNPAIARAGLRGRRSQGGCLGAGRFFSLHRVQPMLSASSISIIGMSSLIG